MTNETKAIVEKHMKIMIEELGLSNDPPCYFGNNAETILTASVVATLEMSKDIEAYFRKEKMLE